MISLLSSEKNKCTTCSNKSKYTIIVNSIIKSKSCNTCINNKNYLYPLYKQQFRLKIYYEYNINMYNTKILSTYYNPKLHKNIIYTSNNKNIIISQSGVFIPFECKYYNYISLNINSIWKNILSNHDYKKLLKTNYLIINTTLMMNYNIKLIILSHYFDNSSLFNIIPSDIIRRIIYLMFHLS